MDRVPPIDPVEHVGELRSGNRDRAAGHGWPDEAAPLQTLGVQRHAKAIMPKDLDQVALGAAEDEKIAGMGIALQGFLDLQSQAVHAAPHVGSPDREPHMYA